MGAEGTDLTKQQLDAARVHFRSSIRGTDMSDTMIGWATTVNDNGLGHKSISGPSSSPTAEGADPVLSGKAGTHGLDNKHILEVLGPGKKGRTRGLLWNDFNDEEVDRMFKQMTGRGVPDSELQKLRSENGDIKFWIHGLDNAGGELTTFRAAASEGGDTPFGSGNDQIIEFYDKLIGNVRAWENSVESKGELAESGGAFGRLADITGIKEFEEIPTKIIPKESLGILDLATFGAGSATLLGAEGAKRANQGLENIAGGISDVTRIKEIEEDIFTVENIRFGQNIQLDIMGFLFAPITGGLSLALAQGTKAFIANSRGEISVSDALENTAWGVGSAVIPGGAGSQAVFAGSRSYIQNGNVEDALEDAAWSYAGSNISDPNIRTAFNAGSTYVRTGGDVRSTVGAVAANYAANKISGSNILVDPDTGQPSTNTTTNPIRKWEYNRNNRPVNPDTGRPVRVGTPGSVTIAEYEKDLTFSESFRDSFRLNDAAISRLVSFFQDSMPDGMFGDSGESRRDNDPVGDFLFDSGSSVRDFNRR